MVGHHRRLLRLTQDLIRIDSQNPPGNERKIAEFVRDYLKPAKLSTRLVEFGQNRTNTITVLKGKKSTVSLLVTPHLDTVPIGRNWKYPALGGEIHQGKLYGRGATDCKGNLAVGLEVFRTLAEEKIRFNYDIIFSATADEEVGSQHGLIPLLGKKILRPTHALILDADECDIIIAQKGLLHIKIGIEGKKAHGAYPDRGVNAIDLCTKAIEAVKAIRWSYKKHPLLKPPTVNTGTIRGGDKVNMVADWCECELDIRYLPGTKHAEVMKKIKQAIHSVTPRFKLTVNAAQNPSETPKNHILVRALQQASQKTIGSYHFKGSEGATVMTFLAEKGIANVATGFGNSRCAHATNEYISCANLKKGYALLREFFFIFDRFVVK